MMGNTLLLCILLGYLGLLVLGTHVPEESLPISLHNEFVLHFFAYAGLALLVGGLRVRRKCVGSAGEAGSGSLRLLGVFLLVMGVAVCDEATQPFFGRAFEVEDLTADFSGAAMAIYVVAQWDRVGRRSGPCLDGERASCSAAHRPHSCNVSSIGND